eukprot:6199525-Pleurochrysis_carterae.AAC.3
MNRSDFNHLLSDLCYGNGMTFIALSSMLNKVIRRARNRRVASSAPPNVRYLAFYAINEHHRCVIPSDALS